MKLSHLIFLRSPCCYSNLELSSATQKLGERIETGELVCNKCHKSYEIKKFIPRFVHSDNYAQNFGFEWNLHSNTQLDKYTGSKASEQRFFEATRWDRNLQGEIILEVGSGAGRFTEQAASTGATVISMDYSNAVEANYTTNGNKENVCIVQGNIYSMPFPKDFFDKVFCFGVLQHTPDVKKSFELLPQYLKSGGKLAIDIYRKRGFLIQILQTKYWVRPITTRLPIKFLYQLCSIYVKLIWPLTKVIHRLPRGQKINGALLIADFRHFSIPDEKLKEWAILDTFDMLSPTYDIPQTLETMRQWFAEAPLREVEVHYGHNGIEGRGTKI